MPQGSCRGPLLLTIYASKLFSKIKSHLPSAHLHADDTQLYLSFHPLEDTCEAEVLDVMENCIADVCLRIINDKLMLNDDKTEFLVIGTSKQLSKVYVSSIRIGDVDAIPVHSAKSLGSWFDSHMDKATHIRPMLVHPSIRIISGTWCMYWETDSCSYDYCNSLLYGVPDHHMRKLRRFMNASVRLIFCAPKYFHITPHLQQLHWLPIRLRIEFKTLSITFKALQGSAPKYLIDLISVLLPSRYD